MATHTIVPVPPLRMRYTRPTYTPTVCCIAHRKLPTSSHIPFTTSSLEKQIVPTKCSKSLAGAGDVPAQSRPPHKTRNTTGGSGNKAKQSTSAASLSRRVCVGCVLLRAICASNAALRQQLQNVNYK